jgi:Uri superfamily endonuclease
LAEKQDFMQLPQPLIDDLCNAGLAGSDPLSAEFPNGSGAYLLLIGLDRPVVLSIPRFSGVTVAPGWYAYAGNANGPGGLRARVARHLRRNKRVHWHVDHLTGDASVAALCFAGWDECRLVERLTLASAFSITVPGFGSTDCHHCESHLVCWAPN